MYLSKFSQFDVNRMSLCRALLPYPIVQDWVIQGKWWLGQIVHARGNILRTGYGVIYAARSSTTCRTNFT